MKEDTKIKNFGKIIGFGTALFIFVSILYYINFKSNLIDLNLSYKKYILVIIIIYIIISILIKLIKK